MRQRYRIDVRIDDPSARSLSKRWLRDIARQVLTAETTSPAELGIAIVDEETIRRLNRDYSGEDAATDVLSFSLTEGEAFPSSFEGVLSLGEVVIAYPVALRQAAEEGRPLEQELAHLLIHGMLHLLGYDHVEAAEEMQMRAKEEALTAALAN
jgi:probable rRNA maturation factor